MTFCLQQENSVNDNTTPPGPPTPNAYTNLDVEPKASLGIRLHADCHQSVTIVEHTPIGL